MTGPPAPAPAPRPGVSIITLVAANTIPLIGVVALVMSHAVSFVWNYLLAGEFRRVSPDVLMARPYGRVVVLVVVKTVIDVNSHRNERASLAGEARQGRLGAALSLLAQRRARGPDGGAPD